MTLHNSCTHGCFRFDVSVILQNVTIYISDVENKEADRLITQLLDYVYKILSCSMNNNLGVICLRAKFRTSQWRHPRHIPPLSTNPRNVITMGSFATQRDILLLHKIECSSLFSHLLYCDGFKYLW